MSNVLIEIIGVILFIGLALAGALFLGPRFQEATSNSKAAASVQAVSQVSAAVSMYQTSEGAPIDLPSATTTLVNAGYLKSAPVNPVSSSEPMNVTMPTGSVAAGGTPSLVIMSLGNNADAICTAIIRQTGQDPAATNSPFYNPSVLPAVNAGCFRKGTGATYGWMTSGNYYAFARV